MMLMLLFGTLLSYAAMAAAFPLQDANLLAIDKAFGIDRECLHRRRLAAGTGCTMHWCWPISP